MRYDEWANLVCFWHDICKQPTMDKEYTSEDLWDLDARVSNTAQQLWENALEYFKWNKNNPIEMKKTAMSGKGAGEKYLIEAPRMLTVKGLCLFCGLLEEYLQDIWQSRDKASDYYIVATRILYHIHTQNMEYAALDIFNPILVSKLHKIETEEVPTGSITVEFVRNLPKLATSEIEVLEKLDQEMKLFSKQPGAKDD